MYQVEQPVPREPGYDEPEGPPEAENGRRQKERPHRHLEPDRPRRGDAPGAAEAAGAIVENTIGRGTKPGSIRLWLTKLRASRAEDTSST